MSTPDQDDGRGRGSGDDVSAAADNELVKLVTKIIIDAYRQRGASDIHIEPGIGKDKVLVRFAGTAAGEVHRGAG
ncbi:MAG: hypothetical protein IPH39_21310 [Sulfuritalea sp.]|nr:hypothetical protein [Sulfuritalea sp.]